MMITRSKKRKLDLTENSEKTFPFSPIHKLLRSHKNQFSEGKVIYHYGNLGNLKRKELSYKDLDAQSDTLANYLMMDCGVNAIKETIVGVCMPRSPHYLVAIFSIWKAGGTFAPLEHDAEASFNYKLEDTRLSIIIGDDSVKEKISLKNVKFISLDDPIPQTSHRIEVTHSIIEPHTRAYIMYTSGTTGNPKGVEIEHGSLSMLWHSTKELVNEGVKDAENPEQILEQDGALIMSPFTFDASIHELFVGLLTTRVHILSENLRLSPDAVTTIIKKEKITLATFLATFLSELEIDCSTTLRDVISMGSPPKRNMLFDLAKFVKIVRNEWGVTEATVRGSNNPLTKETWSDDRAKSIGFARTGCRIHILDPETFNPSISGEIFIEGSLARGYLNNPDLTEQRFLSIELEDESRHARVYRTGDLGRRQSDGSILFCGRTDREVKLQGAIRVNLDAIQNRVLQYPGIKRVAVITQQRGSMECIIAYLEMHKKFTESTHPSNTEMNDYLNQSGFSRSLPTQYIFCSIPLTQNGKIDYSALPKAEDSLTPQESDQQISQTERDIQKLWEKILGLKENTSSITELFTEYGGNSLAAVRLQNEINKKFALTSTQTITTDMILNTHATIRQQAHFVDQALRNRCAHSYSAASSSFSTPLQPNLFSLFKKPSSSQSAALYFTPPRASRGRIK